MKTYIAFLRGINVSGHKLIKMELLRKALQETNFKKVSTYIQSGNIIFESAMKNSAAIEKKIMHIMEKHFGFDVPVIVITTEELLSVINNNPFIKENLADGRQPYVAFLSDIPKDENLNLLKSIDFGADRFMDFGKTLYICYSDSAGNTKLSGAMIENKLKLKSTSRNWKTILKLYEMAAQTKK